VFAEERFDADMIFLVVLYDDVGVVTTGGVGCSCAASIPDTSAFALSISSVASVYRDSLMNADISSQTSVIHDGISM
jgi:hypothetical protein